MTRLIFHKCRSLLFFILIGPAVSWANDRIPSGYLAVAAESNIPHSLLYAVALTESGKRMPSSSTIRPWPWTLNIAGRGVFFDSRQSAWQALIDSLEAGERSIDIGLMQVNWRYHQARLGSPWQALDPYHNLRVGASILQECYSGDRDWWASVGCYHAPNNPRRADQYRRRVILHWQRVTRAD